MSDPETHLLSVLHAHASSIGPPDVSWAFEHAKTSVPVIAYINAYLQDATLLSSEELALEAHLQKTGALSKLLKQTSSSLAPVKTESALLAETAGLAASTHILREHTAQLQQQKTTLEAMRSRRRAEKERKRKLELSRRRKWAAEQEELQAQFDDLAGILAEEVADLCETVVPHTRDAEEVTKIFESDDRVLTRLERLAGDLVVASDGEHDEVVARVEGLVEKLAALETKAVRKRLDDIYLSYPPSPSPAPEGLQQEIDTIYTDIPAVARSAAYNQFLAPLLSKISDARAARGENWVVGGEYIGAVLDYLRDRTRAQTSMLAESHDRDSAVLTLSATIARESSALSTAPSRPTTPPRQQQQQQDPPRRHGSPVKLGRIPFLTPSHRRRQSSIDLRSSFPELALLSHLGLSLPPASPTRSGPVPPVITDSFMASQIAALTTKVETAAELPTASWEAATAEAALVARVLEDALWAGNEYKEAGELAVVRRDVMAGVAEVDRGVKTLGTLMGRLVQRVEGVEREKGDVAGEGRKMRFVSRWGR